MNIINGTTSQIIELMFRDSTTGMGKTGLTYSTVTAYYLLRGAASPVEMDLVDMTLGTWTNKGFKEVDATNMPGVYQIGLIDASLTGAGAVTLVFESSGVIDVKTEISLVTWRNSSGLVYSDVIKISGDEGAADNLEAMYDGVGYANGNAPATQTAVAAIPTTAMRGTENANTVEPDPAGTAPTVGEIADGIGALNRTWYVYKTGNDGNTGRRTDDAFLTIAAGVSAASEGDVIKLGAGTWTETVTLTDGLTIEGAGPESTIISGVRYPLIIGNDCTVCNLSTTAEDIGGGSIGLLASYKNNILIENVVCFGEMDGLAISYCENVICRGVASSSNFDGFNLSSTDNFLIENCSFSTDCTYATGDHKYAITAPSASGVISGCKLLAEINEASDVKVHGVRVSGGVNIINSRIEITSSDSSHTGNVIGIEALAGSETVLSQNSIITSSDGSGSVYDVDSAGDVTIDGIHHDSTKLHTSGDGTIRVPDDNTTLILADTDELQTNQGAWATATGFATPTNVSDVGDKVDLIPTTAMRGTENANTVEPDPAGTAPTAGEIDTQLSTTHGATAWTTGGSSAVVIGPVAATVNDVAIATSSGGVDYPLSIYQHAEGVYIFQIVDSDDDPVSVSGNTIKFIIFDKDNAIKSSNSTVVIGRSDPTGAPTVYDQVTVTVPITNTATADNYYYVLRDITLKAAYAGGLYTIKDAPTAS